MINFFKNLNKVNSIIILSVLIYISGAIRFYLFPLLSTDAAWTLSSLYDYLRDPNLNTSVYAHEYLGPIFNFNTLHFLLGPIFNVFELNTTNFIIFHFIIIAITGSILWFLIRDKHLASLSVLFYAADGYIYGMRGESYTILLALIMLLFWFKIKHKSLRLIISTLIILFIGFIHPVGGVLSAFSFLLLIYLDIKKTDSIQNNSLNSLLNNLFKQLAKVVIIGVTALLFFGIDKSKNMIEVYLTPSGDTSNHFDKLHVDLFLKYAYMGNIFTIIVVFFFSYRYNEKVWFAYILLYTIFLLFSGRSYYFPYFTIPMVILFSDQNSSFEITQRIKNEKFYFRIIFIGIIYVFALNSLKLLSSLKSKDAGYVYKDILKLITSIKKENNNSLLFLPTQLSVDYYKNEYQRIIFPTVSVIYKKEAPIGTNVYFYLSDQITWLDKNPLVFGRRENWKFDTIFHFVPGQYSLMGSIRDFKPINNVGLLKLTRIK